jgi:hypothetical protein
MPRIRIKVGETVSGNEAARRLGLTAQGIAPYFRQPSCPVSQEGNRLVVQWPAFARWRERMMVERAVADATAKYQERAAGLAQAIEAKAIADAEISKAKLARMLGEVVNREESERAIEAIGSALASEVRGLRARYASRLVGIETVQEVAAILDEAASGQLRAMQQAVDAIPEPDDDGEEADE